MSKELLLGREAAHGVSKLFLAKIISRGVGIVGGIALIRLLNPGQYGLIGVVIVYPTLAMLVGNIFGIDVMMTRYVAAYRAQNDQRKLKGFVRAGLIFKLLIGLTLSVSIFLTADFYSALTGRPFLGGLIKLASLGVLIWSTYFGFVEPTLLGLQSMGRLAVVSILNQALSSILSIVLFLAGLGIGGAIEGMLLGSGLTAIVGVYLCLAGSGGRVPEEPFIIGVNRFLGEVKSFGVTIGLYSISADFLGDFFGFIAAVYLTASQIGNYNVAQQFPLFFQLVTLPISSTLFPLFSKINPKLETELLVKTFRYSVRYSNLVTLPVISMSIALAGQITIVLFGISYAESASYLVALSLTTLSIGLGTEQVRRLVMAQGRADVLLKAQLVSIAVGAPLAILLIKPFNVFGLIIAGFVATWPAYAFLLYYARSEFKISIPLGNISRAFSAATIAYFTSSAASLFPTNQLIQIAVGLLLGTSSYILSLRLMSVLSREDIRALADIFGGQAILGRPLRRLLLAMGKALRF